MPNYSQSPIISDFFKTGQPAYFRKGDLIIGIEPEPQGVFCVEKGFVKVYSITDTGEEFVHIMYSHGEIFPYIWAYRKTNPDLYYESLDHSLLWRVSREKFTQAAKNDARLGYELSRQLAQQFQVVHDRLDNLEYKKSSERIAYRLLFLAGRFGKKQSKSVIIDAPITHDLLARSINLTRESVSRELEKLERENIIERHGHKIIICDMNKLNQRLSKPNNLKHWGLD